MINMINILLVSAFFVEQKNWLTLVTWFLGNKGLQQENEHFFSKKI